MKTLKLMPPKWEINQNGVLHSQVAWNGLLFLLGFSPFLIFPNFYSSCLVIPLTSPPHSLSSTEFIFSPSDPPFNSDFFYNGSPWVCTARKFPEPWTLPFSQLGTEKAGQQTASLSGSKKGWGQKHRRRIRLWQRRDNGHFSTGQTRRKK